MSIESEVYNYCFNMYNKGVIVKEIKVNTTIFEYFCKMKGAKHYRTYFYIESKIYPLIITHKYRTILCS